MKRLVLLLALFGCGGSQKPAFTVLTYNVLCSFCDLQNFDPWEQRLDAFEDILRRHDPDVFGLQELFTADEVKQLQKRRPGFTALYFHDPQRQNLIDYPDATLFYRTTLFDALESGTYWLSDTPEVAWSGGWSSGQIWRLVTWARLRHKPSGRDFYVATTHVDNNHPNQEHSAQVLLQQTGPIAQTLPVILMGDFNSTPATDAYQALLAGANGFAFLDAHDLALKQEVLFNAPQQPAYDAAERIDQIFLGGAGKFRVERWSVDLFTYGASARYPSDHFPISVKLSF